jgi:SHS2 domain-containing protein
LNPVDAPVPAADAPVAPPRYRFRGDVAIADAAFEAFGATIEELFVAAADATTNTMAEHLEAIEDRQRRPIRIEEASADLLLFRFLGELIYLKDAEGLLVRVPAVLIRRQDGVLILEAEARGEPLDPLRHRPQADVKAVTLHRLRVEHTAQGWEASVVLDI